MSEGKKTILLVDDDVVIAAEEARQLENEGFAVVEAYCGADAIREIELRPNGIDLVLMDIDLGEEMDGTDVARKILETADMPIVFLSSHTEKDVVENTEKITSYGYVVKNTGATVLSASIKMAFKLHEANKQLRCARDNFAAVFHSSPDSMVISRVCDGLVLDINDAFTDLMGFSREESVGRRSLEDLYLWVNPGDRDRLRREVEIYGRSKSIEAPMRTKEGAVLILQLSVRKIVHDGGPCFIMSARDVTARNRAEEALKESEEKFRMLAEQSLFGMLIIQNGVVVFCNRTTSGITEYPEEEMLNGEPFEFMKVVHPRFRPFIMDQALKKQSDTDGAIPRHSWQMITKSGKDKWIDSYSRTIRYRNQTADFVTMIDVTETKRAHGTIAKSPREMNVVDV